MSNGKRKAVVVTMMMTGAYGNQKSESILDVFMFVSNTHIYGHSAMRTVNPTIYGILAPFVMQAGRSDEAQSELQDLP